MVYEVHKFVSVLIPGQIGLTDFKPGVRQGERAFHRREITWEAGEIRDTHKSPCLFSKHTLSFLQLKLEGRALLHEKEAL